MLCSTSTTNALLNVCNFILIFGGLLGNKSTESAAASYRVHQPTQHLQNRAPGLAYIHMTPSRRWGGLQTDRISPGRKKRRVCSHRGEHTHSVVTPGVVVCAPGRAGLTSRTQPRWSVGHTRASSATPRYAAFAFRVSNLDVSGAPRKAREAQKELGWANKFH